jgi:tRNA (pseudouridine54-N1)-methyltransferase
MARTFVLLSHAVTSPSFLVRDLAGSGRRMDVVCRAAQAALFLSHGVREGSTLLAVLHGPPRPPATVRFEGSLMRKVHPDERVLGIFLQKALAALERAEARAPGAGGAGPAPSPAEGCWPAGGGPPPGVWVASTPGISARRSGLGPLLAELGRPVRVLREGGADIREAELPDEAVYVFGDYLDPEEGWLGELAAHGPEALSVGPLSLFASHAMVLVHNELDRREAAQPPS